MNVFWCVLVTTGAVSLAGFLVSAPAHGVLVILQHCPPVEVLWVHAAWDIAAVAGLVLDGGLELTFSLKRKVRDHPHLAFGLHPTVA